MILAPKSKFGYGTVQRTSRGMDSPDAFPKPFGNETFRKARWTFGVVLSRKEREKVVHEKARLHKSQYADGMLTLVLNLAVPHPRGVLPFA